MVGFIYSSDPLFFLLVHESGNAQTRRRSSIRGQSQWFPLIYRSQLHAEKNSKHAPAKAVKKKRKTGSECGCKQQRITTFANKSAEYFHYTTVWRINCQVLSF